MSDEEEELAASSTKRKRQREDDDEQEPLLQRELPEEEGERPIMHLPEDRSWREALKVEFEAPYFRELYEFVEGQRKLTKGGVFPPAYQMWTAFDRTPIDNVRVVIVGQDPYVRRGQAHGLAFSVPKGMSVPPSLQNIYAELERTEVGFVAPDHGCLESWADQGVFLLNSILSVSEGRPASHGGHGWERFTDAVIRAIARKRRSGVVYMLWGRYAQNKADSLLLDPNKNLILSAPHPSPMSSSPFVGCGHFERANKYLKKPIDWCSVCRRRDKLPAIGAKDTAGEAPKAKRPRF